MDGARCKGYSVFAVLVGKQSATMELPDGPEPAAAIACCC